MDRQPPSFITIYSILYKLLVSYSQPIEFHNLLVSELKTQVGLSDEEELEFVWLKLCFGLIIPRSAFVHSLFLPATEGGSAEAKASKIRRFELNLIQVFSIMINSGAKKKQGIEWLEVQISRGNKFNTVVQGFYARTLRLLKVKAEFLTENEARKVIQESLIFQNFVYRPGGLLDRALHPTNPHLHETIKVFLRNYPFVKPKSHLFELVGEGSIVRPGVRVYSSAASP